MAPPRILFTQWVSFEENQTRRELGLVINIDNISILNNSGNEYGNSVP